MEWNFGKSTKKCTLCDKRFELDEEYFSALLWDKTKSQRNNFIRLDYCLNCWGYKPSDFFSFWKTRLLRKSRPKTPREILVEFFDNLLLPTYQLQSDTPIPTELREKIIYLFSLILLRKKILRIKQNIQRENKPWLILERLSDGKTYEVPEVTISPDELISLQDKFSRLFEFEI